MSFRARVVDLVESVISVACLPMLAPRSEKLQPEMSRKRLVELNKAFPTEKFEYFQLRLGRAIPKCYSQATSFEEPDRIFTSNLGN